MWWRSILFAMFVAVSIAKDSYVVVLPKSFRAGVPLSVSVNILHETSDVSVTATLVNKAARSNVASATGTFSHGHPGSLTIQVPDDLLSGSFELSVVGTGGISFSNTTSIVYESKSISLFVQTDKAMYKPGQTVNFRAFAVFPNLTVYTGPMDIDIYDAASNKIKQWKGQVDPSGVITKFMVMDTQPVLGDWKIKVMAHRQSMEKSFTIEHYVLPKFEVTVELPSFALTTDGTIAGKVKATYTYGKPVTGKVTITAKIANWGIPYHYYGDQPAVKLHTQVDGETLFSIPMTQIMNLNLNRYINGRSLEVEANVTESLNNITLSGKSQVKFYAHAMKLEFLKSNPKTFKPGLSYTAYLSVVQQDGVPLSNAREQVNLTTSVTWQEKMPSTTPYDGYAPRPHSYDLPSQLYYVPDTGIILIQVDIPENASSISLQADYGKVYAYLTLSKYHSPSDSYMQLFLKSTNIQAGGVADFEIKATETVTDIVYQVMSRGSIVATGTFSGTKFSVPVTAEMAPNARIIVYFVRTDGEVVTDSISFDVDGVFKNKVALHFDKKKAQPGDSVNMVVTADPNSLVNLLAVDQSVLLLKSGNDITPQQVMTELKSYDTIQPESYILFGKDRFMHWTGWWGYPIYYGGSDARQIFDNAGVEVMTDANVFHYVPPFVCDNQFYGTPIPRFMPCEIPTAGTSLQPQMETPDKVRSVFPETWLWTNTTTRADGSATISTTVPDTITSWIASAFAVNTASGLGVSPSTAKIEAFKPFFVSLNLPYSVVRDEQLALQANVFNYMTQALDVVVTLEQSNDIRNIIVDAGGNKQYISRTEVKHIHVKAGEAKSVFFPIIPAALGKVPITVKAQSVMAADAVKRQLLVEPEGVPKEYSNPVLINLKNQSSYTTTVPLSMPQTTVAGSQRGVVTVIGDLMGPTVNGLDKLLRMPTGCGEQTMIGLAPDVFVTNYLMATNQLTGDIEAKAINFIEKGYQRELTYQHTDGSFSAFGDSDKSGSMWLTAFVVKSFHQASKLVFIDDEVMVKAINWMIQHQNVDGSFPEPGRVLIKDMRGGAISKASLTAFVLISLLENSDLMVLGMQTQMSAAISSALTFLETQMSTMTDDYTLALTSYAMELAKSGLKDDFFTKFNQDAIVKDGTKHWHKAQMAQTSSSSLDYVHYWQPSHSQANPIDIEMSAYALLNYAARKDFAAGMPVMKWITSQRNSRGGFSSTQDTIVGLQALSDFVRMAYSDSFDIQVTITAGTFTKTFSVNRQNALVLQTVVLPSIPSQVDVSATGHGGMALLDVELSFHVEQEIEEPKFDMTVTMVTETRDMLSIKTCARWLLTGSSGMAVQEFGIPSGFEADLEGLQVFSEIKRTESQDRKVILYFDEISTTPTCITMDVYRVGMVAKNKPAAVRLYDYYEPKNQVTKFYESQRLKNSDVCDVCAECGCAAVGGR